MKAAARSARRVASTGASATATIRRYVTADRTPFLARSVRLSSAGEDHRQTLGVAEGIDEATDERVVAGRHTGVVHTQRQRAGDPAAIDDPLHVEAAKR